MRPTSEKERIKSENENGITLTIDPGIKNSILTAHEAEIWLEFATQAIKGLASNPDLTANNPPTFVTDEACLMADRMLLNYRFRAGEREPDSPQNNNRSKYNNNKSK